MNRTLLLLLSVLLLGGIAWYLTGAGATPERVSDRAPERRFGIESFDRDVHRIFIADRKGHQTDITRGGVTGWLANGRPANENIMSNLRDAVKNLEVQQLPAQKAKPNMIKNLASDGILVQVFDKEDNKLRGYYIGGTTYDEEGTFAIVEGSEEPYVVGLPHFTGAVRIRFAHWEDEWRDRVYFRVDPDEVEEISIDYPTQRNLSFRLTRDGKNFQLSPLYDSGRPTKKVPFGRVEAVLARYEKYYVNRYENKDTETLEYAKTILPFATITVKQKDQEPQTMKVYPRYEGREFITTGKQQGEVINGKLEAYTAFINNDEDWVLLNVETTAPLLVGYGSF